MLKLIAGLGNPGKKYSDSRHNAGFRVVKALAEKYSIKNTTNRHDALIAKGLIETEKVILAQPTTYMNRSGTAVKQLINYYKIDIKDIIVIYDDMDLTVGTIRIRKKGSSGGHKGLQSVINYIKTEEFPRIRIGIGKSGENIDVRNYVLGKFTLEEEKIIEKAVNNVVDSIKEIYVAGFRSAMNKYN